MNWIIRVGVFLVLFLISQLCKAQFGFIGQKLKIDTQSFITYYPFYNGQQMIKIDHDALFVVNASKADSWHDHMKSSAPPSYFIINGQKYLCPTYIFRDSSGKITKIYSSMQYIASYKLISVNSVFTKAVFYPANPSLDHGYGRVPLLKNNVCLIQDTSGLLGLMDTFGNILLKRQYEEIKYLTGNYLVQKDKKWALMNDEFKVLTPFQFEKLESIRTDYYKVFMDGGYGIINRRGNYVLNPTHGDIKQLYRHSHLYTVWFDRKQGLLDSTFNIIQNTEYNYFQRSGEGILTRDANTLKFGLLNLQGQQLLAPIYDGVQHLRGTKNLYWAHQKLKKPIGDFYGVINSSGEWLFPLQNNGVIWHAQDKKFEVRKGEVSKWYDQFGVLVEE